MACSSSSSPPWRFAVLLTGHASPYTEHKYGGYGRLLVDLLRDGSDSWDIIPVLDDALIPPLPDLARYHGFVISGSKADAHADDPWILRLCQTLRDLHLRRKKLLGICFGHQILARALGGKTDRAAVGWELGARAIDLSVESLSTKLYGKDFPSVLRVIESHQDQVQEIPPGAECLGYSERTPIEIFAIGDHVLGIQGHPEFEADVITDIIESRLALGVISEEVANHAKASIVENTPDKAAWQKLCKDFLKSDVCHET